MIILDIHMLVYNTYMQKVLVIGSTVCDITLYMDHIPSLEEDINLKSQKMSVGGCAWNVANMLRLCSVPYQLFSPAGTGIYGDFVRAAMEEKEIKPAFDSLEANGACYCLVDAEGNRTFMALHGAEYHIYKKELDKIDMHDTAYIYVCGLEIEETTGNDIISFLEEHKDKKICFAPGARVGYIDEEKMKRMLALNPLLHLNRREAGTLLKDSSLTTEDMALSLYHLTHEDVVITDGAKDTVITEDGIVKTIPAVKAEVKDGNGAGDCHIGSVLAYLAKGYTLSKAVSMANYYASVETTYSGSVIPDAEFRKLKGIE